MSSCLSGGGGGRAYRLETLNLEMIKSPQSTTSWISNSSSPSSTLSESSNCPLAITTRKPRTPRKRPNQTYNEAAAILSTAYPKIFPTKHLTKPCKFTKKSLESKNPFSFEPSDTLLVPYRVIDDSGFLLNPQRPDFSIGLKGLNPFEKPCLSPGEINSQGINISEICDKYHHQEHDFDAESILDEEIGEGIDCIMGDLALGMDQNESIEDFSHNVQVDNGFCYGYPVGLGFDFKYGMRKEVKAIRNGDEGDDWWRFPSVSVVDLNPKVVKNVASAKKKKKMVELKNLEPKKENLLGVKWDSEELIVPKPNAGLLLKLNYDNVLNAWSDKASPFSGDSPGGEVAGNDVQARLAQIDLFSDNGGIREASVLRYKEKRRTRLFSKKIRYQVRKVNADRRPRMKGRFVRTPNED